MDTSTDWTLIDFDPPKPKPAPIKNACPKCGKELPKHGAHWHIKACEAV